MTTLAQVYSFERRNHRYSIFRSGSGFARELLSMQLIFTMIWPVLFDLPADFIVDVVPAHGFIGAGNEQDITITYDSEGYDVGDYEQELLLESNDPDQPEYIINNTMHVYLPAMIAGTVTDCDNDSPLGGVTVTAGPFQASTGEDGQYNLVVDPGGYNLLFEKLGYQTIKITGSQNTLYSDNFESYAVGNYLAAVSPTYWTTWSNSPGTGEDGVISNTYAYSPTKSVRVDEADGQTDLVLKLGDKTSGVYDVSWYLYVPTGYAGYYNFQHFQTPGIEWAADVYFLNDGTGRVDAGGYVAATFTYAHNTWILVNTTLTWITTGQRFTLTAT